MAEQILPGGEFPEEIKISDDKRPSPALKNDERDEEVHQFNEQVSGIQEELPGKNQNITGQTTKKLMDISLRIKYMISHWEFNIMWALTKHQNNKISSRRVGWKCVCGADLFDDFRGLSDYDLKPTRRWELRQNERFKFLDKRRSGLGWLPTMFSMGRNIRARSGIPSNPFGRFQISNLPSSQQTANILSFSQQPTPTLSNDQYLFLCFNDEKFLGQKGVSLLHLDIPASMNDQTLFATIREAYYSNRGWYKRVLSLKVLARVDFVKFEPFYLENVEICNSRDAPPEANTEYDPKPAETIPPIESFMHFLHNPICALIDGELLSAMLKKKNGRLTHKSKGRTLEWGIHFIEEPSWTRVWMPVGLSCGGLMTYAIWWTRATGDMQGGFGVAAFIAAIGAIITLVASFQVAY